MKKFYTFLLVWCVLFEIVLSYFVWQGKVGMSTFLLSGGSNAGLIVLSLINLRKYYKKEKND